MTYRREISRIEMVVSKNIEVTNYLVMRETVSYLIRTMIITQLVFGSKLIVHDDPITKYACHCVGN